MGEKTPFCCFELENGGAVTPSMGDAPSSPYMGSTATAAVSMLVQEVGATVLAEWSRESVRVANKKLRVHERRVVNEADMGRTGSVRSCVRVDVGTMRADPSVQGHTFV